MSDSSHELYSKVYRMKEKARTIGANAEKQAAEYLLNKGYIVLEKNYCIRGGEIDLIAQEKDYLVFVEVKARKDDSHGRAAEAVDQRKIRRISKTALHYISQNSAASNMNCRFDVIEIYGDEIIHIENAFDADLQ